MKSLIRVIAMLLVAMVAIPAQAALKVLATTPDWGSLTQELGGDRVNVYVATTALQDVHRVEAEPSLVARARSADLVVATGAELEVGWLPVLVQESGNARIQPGAPGYFEATRALRLLEVPVEVRSLHGRHPSAGQSPRAARPAEHCARGAGAQRAARATRSGGGRVLRGARQELRCALGGGDHGAGKPGRAAQGGAGGRSCIATRRTCVTGSASWKLPRSNRSLAYHRRLPTSARWSASSPPCRRG